MESELRPFHQENARLCHKRDDALRQRDKKRAQLRAEICDNDLLRDELDRRAREARRLRRERDAARDDNARLRSREHRGAEKKGSRDQDAYGFLGFDDLPLATPAASFARVSPPPPPPLQSSSLSSSSGNRVSDLEQDDGGVQDERDFEDGGSITMEFYFDMAASGVCGGINGDFAALRID